MSLYGFPKHGLELMEVTALPGGKLKQDLKIMLAPSAAAENLEN